jgi:hypothetical protein
MNNSVSLADFTQQRWFLLEQFHVHYQYSHHEKMIFNICSNTLLHYFKDFIYYKYY